MNREFCVKATAAAMLACVTGWGLCASGQDRPESVDEKTQRTVREPGKLQGKVFMGAKLTATQEVLEGLLTRDFDRIGEAAESLRDVALTTPPAQVRKDFDAEVYDHFRHEFLRLSAQLHTLAEEKNLEGTAYVHQNLTSTCIGCHEYVRDKTLP